MADYLGLADERLATIERLLSGSDSEATSVSLLGLETSSAMLGGQDVAAAARALRHAVDDQHGDSVEVLFDQLRRDVTSLQGYLALVDLTPRSTPHLVGEPPAGSQHRERSR